MGLLDDAALGLRNLWSVTFGDDLEEHEPTPSVVLFDEPHRQLRRYGADERSGEPILLVPPLAAPATCYDFHPNHSLVAYLLEQGFTPYVVDYGAIAFEDRRLGFEDFIDSIVPQAIARVIDDSGVDQVHVLGWSLGGTISLLTGAAHPELPIKSITAVTTPLNYDKYQGVDSVRAISKVTGGTIIGSTIRALGNVHAPLVQAGFRLSALDREITKPWFVAKNLLDTDTLARMQAIDRFTGNMPAYPGRLYNQLWHRLMVANDLAKGRLKLGKRVIDLSRITVPVLTIGSPDDVLAPVGSVKHSIKVLTGANPLRFEVVRGSHLGVITGPTARESSWAIISEFLAAHTKPAVNG